MINFRIFLVLLALFTAVDAHSASTLRKMYLCDDDNVTRCAAVNSDGSLTIGDSNGTIINPATEEKQDDIITALTPYLDDPMLTIAAQERVLLSRVSYINKFGRNPDIDTGSVPEVIWDAGGVWVPPPQARIHDIASTVITDSGALISSGTATGGSTTTIVDTGADFVTDGVAVDDIVINDTNFDHATVLSVAAQTLTLELSVHANDPSHSGVGESGFNTGDTYRVVNADSTGASITHVVGLDADMLEQEEFIIMNGTTNVPTLLSYYRIYRMHIDGAAGRIVTNTGDISATAQTDGTVTAQINAGNGQTGAAIYTIPKGKTGYITHAFADLVRDKTGGASLTLRETVSATVDGAGTRAKHFFGMTVGGGHYHHPFKPYKKILENTDIFIQCDDVTVNDMDISAGFDIILVDNE